MSQSQNANKELITHPYKCEVDVTFPNDIDTKRAFEVLSVDDEIGNRVKKEFFICKTNSEGTFPCPSETDGNVLRVVIEATEAKMLRVALTSFYDMVAIVIKCYQEFGDSNVQLSK